MIGCDVEAYDNECMNCSSSYSSRSSSSSQQQQGELVLGCTEIVRNLDELCPICLECGGTERPPCGFDALLFHERCLVVHGDGGATQCPHCNANAPSVGLKRMRRVLDAWLQTPGLWRRLPLFIPLQRGLMRDHCEEYALRKAVGHAVGAMLHACTQRNEEGIVYASRRTHTKHFIVMFQSGRREATQVVLQRSAVSASSGVVACTDGYTLSASCKRCPVRRLYGARRF
jgi:hypothetical protein